MPVVQSPLHNMMEQVEINMAGIVAGIITANTVDEDGQPYAPQVRAIFSDEPLVVPEVLVEFRPGPWRTQRSLGIVGTFPTQGGVVRQIDFTASRVRLTVRERGEAERRYLLDLILSGMVAGYYAGPPVMEAASLVAASQVGIMIHGGEAIEYPPPRMDDARPEGLLYEAVLSLLCDVAMSWNTPTVTVPQGTATAKQTLT